jgi:coatomer subunit gamma
VEDEYQLEDFEIVSADYMLRVVVSNFRNAWENMDPDSERVDEYGLGVRESLAEAVNAVINILGMQPCEVSFQFSISEIVKSPPPTPHASLGISGL